MEMEEKKNELTEAALPVQELPADIPGLLFLGFPDVLLQILCGFLVQISDQLLAHLVRDIRERGGPGRGGQG